MSNRGPYRPVRVGGKGPESYVTKQLMVGGPAAVLVSSQTALLQWWRSTRVCNALDTFATSPALDMPTLEANCQVHGLGNSDRYG